jgi:hypothetical protein
MSNIEEVAKDAEAMGGTSAEEALDRLLEGIKREPEIMTTMWQCVKNIADDKDSEFYNPQVSAIADIYIKAWSGKND